MARKYSDAIRLRGTKSAYNIQKEESGEWLNFIANEQFNEILAKVIRSVSKKYADEHRSFWLEGTYGTGKSHASAVIKHILCDPIDSVKDYVEEEYHDDKYAILRQSIYDLRKTTRLFPVTMYGQNNIAHKDDLSVEIQSAVSKALEVAGINLSVKTDFDNYISHIEKQPSIWDNVINGDDDLASYAPDRKKLIQELKNSNTSILILMKNALRKSGIVVRLEQENLCNWFYEVQDELAQKTEYAGILLLWDEFTDVMASDLGPSILVELQDLAEASQLMRNNSYFFHIAHPSALDSLRAEERTKTTGRYHFMFYNMEQVSAFRIMSRKFIHDESEDNFTNYLTYHNMTDKYFAIMRDVYEKYAKASNDPEETLEDLKALFPVHPGTANLATYYAREAGSSSRSVFEFLGDNPAIREFLDSEEHFRNNDMITADYLWDFVLAEFNNKVTKYGVVTERYNSYHLHVAKQGVHYSAVFKTILLLNALNNLANNETVTPSEENIRNMFVGTPIDKDMDEILNWINSQGVVQRSPQGIYEIRFSALDTKEIDGIKKQLLNSDYRYTSQVLKYGEVAQKEFLKMIPGVNRPCSYHFYSEEINKYTLLNHIENEYKDAANHEIFLALMMARSNAELTILKDIAYEASQEERFENVAFLVFETKLEASDYDTFIEYLANAVCAQKHGFAEQTKSHSDNAKAIILEWMKNIRSGNGTIYLRKESEVINVRLLSSIINSSIAPRIFFHGPESLEIARRAPQTNWNLQHAKKTAEAVISLATKEDAVKWGANGGEARIMGLLLQDSVDDDLSLKKDISPNHPLAVVCKFVKSKIDHSDKQLSFNLAEKFLDLSKAPYGLYPSTAGYGMLAFAMRPYINKVFDTTGKPINETRMKEFVSDTFKIWESGSNVNIHKVDVKFETKEEGSIAKALVSIFSLNQLKNYKDVSSLTDARWALLESYCVQIGYPLWALKYSDKMVDSSAKEALCTLTDDILKICDAGVKDPHLLVETDQLLSEYRYEYKSLVGLQEKNIENGFRNFLLADTNVKLSKDDYADAFDYIHKNMEDSVGRWTESAVIDKLKNWKLSKTPQPKQTNPTPQGNGTTYIPPMPPQHNMERMKQAKGRIENMESLSEAKNILIELADTGYDFIIDAILK